MKRSDCLIVQISQDFALAFGISTILYHVFYQKSKFLVVASLQGLRVIRGITLGVLQRFPRSSTRIHVCRFQLISIVSHAFVLDSQGEVTLVTCMICRPNLI